VKIKGKVHLFGSNVNTDEIIPARYLNTSDLSELAKHVMEDADPEFPSKVKPGDIIVAKENFGCGSSREHAPLAIKAAGVSCVVASSFARIFFRNAINIGLPIVESKEAVAGISSGDIISIDFEKGEIINETTGKVWEIKPFPDFMKQIINSGGLMGYIVQSTKN